MKSFSTPYQQRDPLPVELLDETGYQAALAMARAARRPDASPLDAVIHDVRVRLYTDQPRWREFWTVNWFTPSEWASVTAQMPASELRIRVYAFSEANGRPWAGYSPTHHSAFLVGDVPYGALRALTLNAVGHLLAAEEGAHLLTGACMERDGRGTLLLCPPDLNAAAQVQALVALTETNQAHLVALDGVVLRYGLVRMVDDVPLLPTFISDEAGASVRGYQLFPWLQAHGYAQPRAYAHCLTLEADETYCFARDLDLERAPEAYAFPLEKAWYVPTQPETLFPERVESHPWSPIRIRQVARLGDAGLAPLDQAGLREHLVAADLSLYGPEGRARAHALTETLVRALAT